MTINEFLYGFSWNMIEFTLFDVLWRINLIYYWLFQVVIELWLISGRLTANNARLLLFIISLVLGFNWRFTRLLLGSISILEY